jgi:hypothetical protein
MSDEPAMIAARWVVSLLVIGGISSFTAYRKGYKPSWWLFGCGCLGLLIVAFLPNTKTSYMTREQKTVLRKRGDLLGMCLTGLGVILNVVLLIKVFSTK